MVPPSHHAPPVAPAETITVQSAHNLARGAAQRELPEARFDRIAELRRRIDAVSPPGVRLLSADTDLKATRSQGGGQAESGAEPITNRIDAAIAMPAVHEIRPTDRSRRESAAAIAAAARVFALMLMARQLARQALDPDQKMRHAPVVWCEASGLASECGQPHGPGLDALGFDPSRLLLVLPRTRSDTLWTIEESLKSESLAGVIGVIDRVDLTLARRLSLAAAAGRTPCLMVTGHGSSGLAGAATRWLVDLEASATNRFDRAAPGTLAFGITLDRCRPPAPLPIGQRTILEWCDDAYRFRLAPRMADRSDAASGERPAVDGWHHPRGRPRGMAHSA